MKENNALVQTTSFIPSESEFQLLQVISRNAALSGLYGSIGSEQKIFMILLAARELGIPPMQALNGGLWNIKGKIEISSRLMNSMIRRAGHSLLILECNEKICKIEGKRCDNGDSFSAKFTIEEAVKAGLTSKGINPKESSWNTYTEDMLYSRAMSRLARRLFPDVIGTAYVEGEIREAKFSPIPVESKKVETEEEKEALFTAYLEKIPDLEGDKLKEFFQRYANHYGKSIEETLLDYQDEEKLRLDFGKWVQKQTKA